MSALTAENKKLLESASVSTLTNLMLKRGFRNAYMHGIAPLSTTDRNMVGPAYTLRFIPSREDLDTMAGYASDQNVHRRAIEECPPGHVLVIDAHGSSRAASAGDMMVARLKARGVAGIVTDGGFRDTADIEQLAFPAFQRETAPAATPIALHAADLNLPIACGGVAVYPGDIIVGATDGVIVLPAHLANEIAEEAADVAAYEEFVAEKISAGHSIFGLFPATEASRKEYESWRATKCARK
jgi:regulator of RNase E activity RraA